MMSRRELMQVTACGFPFLALAGTATDQSLTARKPHFVPKVKRIIFFFMQGAPSQYETFDYNDELVKAAGQTT